MRASYNSLKEVLSSGTIIADMKMRASYNKAIDLFAGAGIIADMKMRASYNTRQELLVKDLNPEELDYDNYWDEDIKAHLSEFVRKPF